MKIAKKPYQAHDDADFLGLREETFILQEELDFDEDLHTRAESLRGNSSKLAIFSFFAGSGLLDLGFEGAGFKTIFVNEWNPEFLRAYEYAREKMHKPKPTFGTSTASVECFLKQARKRLSTMVALARPNHLVGFIGGPPCPDFSVGGKNRGSEGENGRLTKTYFELVQMYQPDWFLFENVKGLWSTKRHRAFYTENIEKVKKSGYAVTERLVNAIEFGAPQDRERVIAIGFSSNVCKKLGLMPGADIPIGRFPWEKFVKFPREKVFSYPWPRSCAFGSIPIKPASVPKELTISHWFQNNKVDRHPNASFAFKPRAGLERFLTVDEGDDSRKSYKRLHRWRYSPTACYGNNEVHLHPILPRRISVAEVMAIQSLPENFELPPTMTLSAMFKTLGNGVPYLAGLGLAKTIKSFLEEHCNDHRE